MFKASELSVMAYANNFTLWHYNATQLDSVDTVATPGFFDNATDMFRQGDRMFIQGNDGRTYDMNVISNINSVVTVEWASIRFRQSAPADPNVGETEAEKQAA